MLFHQVLYRSDKEGSNSVLLVFRTTPFTAADLRLVKYAATLLTTYLTWWQIILMAAAAVAAHKNITCLGSYLYLLYDTKGQKVKNPMQAVKIAGKLKKDGL